MLAQKQRADHACWPNKLIEDNRAPVMSVSLAAGAQGKGTTPHRQGLSGGASIAKGRPTLMVTDSSSLLIAYHCSMMRERYPYGSCPRVQSTATAFTCGYCSGRSVTALAVVGTSCCSGSQLLLFSWRQ